MQCGQGNIFFPLHNGHSSPLMANALGKKIPVPLHLGQVIFLCPPQYLQTVTTLKPQLLIIMFILY